MNELTEIDRLDLAARAEATKTALSRAQIVMTIFCLFSILLAVGSEASRPETIAVWVVAMLAVVTAGLLWARSRYAAYALALLAFATLIGRRFASDDPDSHTMLGATSDVVACGIILFWGYRWWTNGLPFMTAQSKELEMERSRVGDWIKLVKSAEGRDKVIEFSTKSFVRGYWTYRLLDTGFCWLIAKFKTGNMNRLRGCRILGPDAVRATEQPGGKLCIKMGDEPIQEVEISAEMRHRLLHVSCLER